MPAARVPDARAVEAGAPDVAPKAKTASTPSAAPALQDADCTRDNAARGPTQVDAAQVQGYVLERNERERVLRERFTFEGHDVESQLGGCVHAGWRLTVSAPTPIETPDALLELLRRLPLRERELFVTALQAPQTCSEAGEDWRILRCDDVRILMRLQGAKAELIYDFPL